MPHDIPANRRTLSLYHSNILFYLVWIAFAAFLVFAYRSVFLFFDDFGYVSLSYAYTVPDVSGTDFTISQLLQFLREIYFRWSGRVVYPGIKILALQHSLWTFRAINIVSVFFTFYLIYRLSVPTNADSNNHYATNRVLLSVFTCTLFGLFSLGIFRVGFFWFSASATFVIPLVFFMLAWYLARRIRQTSRPNKPLVALCCISIVLATVSVEQTAITVAVFFAVISLCDYLQERKIRWYNVWYLASAALGCMFFFLAPGNFQRFDAHATEDAQSTLGRIYANISETTSHFLRWRENGLFLLVLCAFVCYLAITLGQRSRLHQIVLFATPAITAALLFVTFAEDFTFAFPIPHPNATRIVVFGAFVLVACYLIIGYLLANREYYLLAYFIASSIAQLIFLPVAPYIVERMLLVLYISFFTVFIRIFYDMLLSSSPTKLIATVLIPLTVFSTLLVSWLTLGYASNREANIQNDRIFRQASTDISNGIEVDQIILEPVNLFFSPGQPDIAFFWIIEYYDIPFGTPILAPGTGLDWWPSPPSYQLNQP